MPEDPNIHPHWAAEAKQIAQNIDRLDYFEVLSVTQEATLADLKAKYHALQRNYHPDTFYTSPDVELRAAVTKIAKRVAEAYVILRDPEKRAKYTRDIQGPERNKKLRFSEASEQEARREKEQELGKTPQTRQLVQKAMASMKKGDWAAADRDLRTALIFEKNNPQLKDLHQEVLKQLKPGDAPKKPPGRDPTRG